MQLKTKLFLHEYVTHPWLVSYLMYMFTSDDVYPNGHKSSNCLCPVFVEPFPRAAFLRTAKGE